MNWFEGTSKFICIVTLWILDIETLQTVGIFTLMDDTSVVTNKD